LNFKIILIQKFKIQELDFQKDSNFVLNFQNLLWFILNPIVYSPWFKFEYLNQLPKLQILKVLKQLI
jgi:hypothetical protein